MNRKKTDIRITIGILVAVIAAMVYLAVVENQVEVVEGDIRISGIYGTVIEKEDIVQVALVEELPRIQRRVNGASYFGVKKGVYRMEGIERARLLIHSGNGPYLRIDSDDQVVFINYRESQKTMDAYNEVLSGTGL